MQPGVATGTDTGRNARSSKCGLCTSYEPAADSPSELTIGQSPDERDRGPGTPEELRRDRKGNDHPTGQIDDHHRGQGEGAPVQAEGWTGAEAEGM